MKILIVGLGSIAKKHIWAIREIDQSATIYALRSSYNSDKLEGIINVYSFSELNIIPDFIIISNPTSQHYSSIKECSQFKVPMFIEKPPLMSMDRAWELAEELANKHIITYIACNLRFHPIIEFLKKELPKHRLLEAIVYVGSFLPDWRPGRDYTKIYSSIAELGGGVHLDMFHELDYTNWLLGKPYEVTCTIKHISDLNISSADYAHYQYLYPDKVATITMNYYRKDSKRSIELVFDDVTWLADLENSTILDMNGNIIYSSEYNIMDTYLKQMKYFISAINSDFTPMNSFKESLEILSTCLYGSTTGK